MTADDRHPQAARGPAEPRPAERVPAEHAAAERRAAARRSPRPDELLLLHRDGDGPASATGEDRPAIVDEGRPATVLDGSAGGLRIRVPLTDQGGQPAPGSFMQVTMTDAAGSTVREARVAWVTMTGEACDLGLEFLPTDPSLARLNLDEVQVDPAWALRIPAGLATRRQVLPFACRDGVVHVACANAGDVHALQAVQRFVKHPLRAEEAEPGSLQRALRRVFGPGTSGAAAGPREAAADLAATAFDLDHEDAVKACEWLLHAAILRQASDIHFDPVEEAVRIRLRVDGVLEDVRLIAPALYGAMSGRLKVLAGMDIAEKRAPQDGRFRNRAGPGGTMVDIRVATIPTKYGERMSLRLLSLQAESLTLEKLGMGPGHLQVFQQALSRPHGIILLTGPTGCGKTTTLYAGIRKLLGQRPRNIVTVEDPVEYDIPGVAQVEVDTADKVSFAKALRSIVRHDPDIVMIGEIRDAETAEVAIRAALTGHLVLSTLHTNSAAGAITRLADLGLQRYLIAATLRLVVAQRLVRRLCRRCRRSVELTAVEAIAMARADRAGSAAYGPGGCTCCSNKGYAGRVGLFEMLPMDEAWARQIALGQEETETVAEMRRRGLPMLIDDAWTKLERGLTSAEETVRATTVW